MLVDEHEFYLFTWEYVDHIDEENENSQGKILFCIQISPDESLEKRIGAYIKDHPDEFEDVFDLFLRNILVEPREDFPASLSVQLNDLVSTVGDFYPLSEDVFHDQLDCMMDEDVCILLLNEYCFMRGASQAFYKGHVEKLENVIEVL